MTVFDLNELEAIRLTYSTHRFEAGLAELTRPHPLQRRMSFTYAKYSLDPVDGKWKWTDGDGTESDSLLENIPQQGWNGQAIEFWDGLHRGYEEIVRDWVSWSDPSKPGAIQDIRTSGWELLCRHAGGALYSAPWLFGFRHGYTPEHIFHSEGIIVSPQLTISDSTSIENGTYTATGEHITDPFSELQSTQFRLNDSFIFRRNGVWFATHDAPDTELLSGEINENTFPDSRIYPPETGWNGFTLKNTPPAYTTTILGHDLIYTNLQRQGRYAITSTQYYFDGIQAPPDRLRGYSYNWWGAISFEETTGWRIGGGYTPHYSIPPRDCDKSMLWNHLGPHEAPHSYHQQDIPEGDNPLAGATLQMYYRFIPGPWLTSYWTYQGNMIIWDQEATEAGEWQYSAIMGPAGGQVALQISNTNWVDTPTDVTIELTPLWETNPIIGQWLLDDIRTIQTAYETFDPPEDEQLVIDGNGFPHFPI